MPTGLDYDLLKNDMKKNLLVIMVFLFCSLLPEYVPADDYQSKSQEANYYVVLTEIGDYSGTLTLLRTYRKLTPDGYYVYAIQDELDKEAMVALVEYFDCLIAAYAYRDEVAEKVNIIDVETFIRYLNRIKF